MRFVVKVECSGFGIALLTP
nr:hypothetical protein [Vibrio vulnificus]